MAAALAEPWSANPFLSVEAWDPRRPIVLQLDEGFYEKEPWPVSDADLRCFRTFSAFANGEGVCWPSQDTVADLLGECRETTCRRVGRLCKAGRMRIAEKRLSRRTCWRHNVYELPGLAYFPVSPLGR